MSLLIALNKTVSLVRVMTNILIIKIVTLVCISIGGLTSIIATAGKEWEKQEFIGTRMKKTTYGLWYFCRDSECKPTIEIYEHRENSKSLTGRSLYLYNYWSK